MPGLRVILLGALTVLAVAVAIGVYLLRSHPSTAPYAALEMKPVTSDNIPLRAKFLGVATVLLDDGETAIMTDGFFSRPGAVDVLLRKIEPDRARIADGLAKAGVTRLAAVMTTHSHHDHAMDAPVVADSTGAVLIGSASTANIARGLDFPEDRIRVVSGGESFTFGRFKITVIEALHSPGGYFMGAIAEPLRPPVRASAYKEGGSFAYLVEHDGSRILIHASANLLPGLPPGAQADTAFLGVATLGKQSPQFIADYWRQVVRNTGTKLVIPIHWDNFFRPLSKPLEPLPYAMDDFERTMQALLAHAEADRVAIRLPPLFATIDPFAKNP